MHRECFSCRQPVKETVLQVIDVWAQQPNPTFLAQPYFDSLKKWTGVDLEDVPLEFLLQSMDAAGVSRPLPQKRANGKTALRPYGTCHRELSEINGALTRVSTASSETGSLWRPVHNRFRAYIS